MRSRTLIALAAAACFQPIALAHFQKRGGGVSIGGHAYDPTAVVVPADEAQKSNTGLNTDAKAQGLAAPGSTFPGVTAPSRTATKVKTTTKSKTNNVPSPAFPYGKTPVRGVNLGAWLVAEAWMVPSLFEGTNDSRIVDEWTMGQYLGRAAATARMQQHWQTWITEDDFAQIKSYGLNHVRIPFGYWGLDISAGEPYVQGSYEYLLQGIAWAAKYGLKVMVDLHGAPNSQNGYDNSGRAGYASVPYLMTFMAEVTHSAIHWADTTQSLNRTTAVLLKLASTFSQPQYCQTVTMIEVVNEPAAYANNNVKNKVKPYYYQAYQAIRYANASTPNGMVVTIHDAFEGLSSWQGFMNPPTWQNVVLDTHVYINFNPSQGKMTDAQLASYFCGMADSFQQSNDNLWTVTGEWTPSKDDCAGLSFSGGSSQFANTYGRSACKGRTYALGTSLSKSYKTSMRKSWEVQVDLYEKYGSGWIQWAWKQEVAKEWSYLGGIQGGWIPKDPTERKYGDQCA